MGFFSNLFKRRSGGNTADSAPAAPVHAMGPRDTAPTDFDVEPSPDATARVNQLSERPDETFDAGAIWDTPALEPAEPKPGARARRNKTRMLGFDATPRDAVGLFDEPDMATAPPSAPEPPQNPDPSPAEMPAASRRVRRNKTRMIGFDTVADDALGFFQADAPDETPMDLAEAAPAPDLPVGWVVVIRGPGRGTAVTLTTGASDIGTGASHVISIDTGSPALTASTHGTVTHDGSLFTLTPNAHGEVMVLNGDPVLATTKLTSGDTIAIGDVDLRFVAFCDGGFSWGSEETAAGGSHAA